MPELVESFARATHGTDDDLAHLDLLLSVRRDVLGVPPCSWQQGDVELLLLELCPRKVQNDDCLLATGPAVLGRYLQWLAATGLLRGAALADLSAEVATVAPQFATAMRDPARHGLAKALLGDVAFDGGSEYVSWTDGVDVEAVEPPGSVQPGSVQPGSVQPGSVQPGSVLGPVSLADDDELRRLAESSQLVRGVGALLSHVGPQGRLLTQNGALRLVDATALAEPCGDADRLHRPAHWEHQVRRMADLPMVTEAYELALAVGLLSASGTRVRRDLSQPGATDVLARVESLADRALAVGVFVGGPPRWMAWLVDAVSAALPALLAELYAEAAPVRLAGLAERLTDRLGLTDDEPIRDYTGTVRAYLERAFERFERLGVLSRLGVRVPPDRTWLGMAGAEATSVLLTPLGVWWLQRALPEFGLRTPLLGELASVTAYELCVGLDGYPEPAGRAEVDAWRAARGPDEAARQLAALLGHDDLLCRAFAAEQLEPLPAAEQAVRAMLDDPRARPYARLWLGGRGLDVPEEYEDPADDLLLFVESAALAIAGGGVDEMIGQLARLGQPDRQAEVVRQLWRVDSPFTEPVLTALAAAAPPPCGKAARRALHSWRSAGRG